MRATEELIEGSWRSETYSERARKDVYCPQDPLQ